MTLEEFKKTIKNKKDYFQKYYVFFEQTYRNPYSPKEIFYFLEEYS
jgi:hypothetical protein